MTAFGLRLRLYEAGSGPDSFETGTKLVRISLAFIKDLADSPLISSLILYQIK